MKMVLDSFKCMQVFCSKCMCVWHSKQSHQSSSKLKQCSPLCKPLLYFFPVVQLFVIRDCQQILAMKVFSFICKAPSSTPPLVFSEED